ncbi:hypothetical protein [Pandoraea sp. NPDC090278]|uniref:hypothetical protein n=1 Tax=Pandoraea sp. NPDC090278 TaxID=3364391 RepID=UPI003839FCA9
MNNTREVHQLCHRILDADGNMVAAFDLSAVDVHSTLASAFLRAHAAEFGHTSIESQKQAHRAIRKLILCLQEHALHNRVPLPISIAQIFHDWIKSSGLNESTAQSHQNIVVAVLRWCARNLPGTVHPKASMLAPSFRRPKPTQMRRLEESEVRSLLSACYEEIEATEMRLARGRMCFSENAVSDGELLELRKTVIDLLRAGKGQLPNQKVVNRSGLALARRVSEQGGLRQIVSSIYITIEDIVPFYLAVLMQTGGNPMAIRSMKLDCLSGHPLRDDLECLTWEKPRANREQRVDFPAGKEWSAPNLIRRLVAMNSDLRANALARDRESVFLARNFLSSVARVPSVQSLHNYLALFLKKFGLQDFDFKHLRATSAWAHYWKTGAHDVVRRRLNHANVRTTTLYTLTDEIAPEHYKIISKFQGELVTKARGEDAQRESTCLDREKLIAHAKTVFGFECRDPFGGLDGTTAKGSRCLNFTRCSTCPGAIVPLDDVSVIARLLATQASLEEARVDANRRGWSKRYRSLYADTLRIISETILPGVSPEVLTAAKAAMGRLPPIPKPE